METTEKPEYAPPTPEVIAQTQAQVQSFDCATVTDVPQIECEALVALYNSTNGAGWKISSGWLGTTTVDSWAGVTVVDGHIQGIGLSSNRLSGSIPFELGSLASLQYLGLSDNQLSGSIPPELGSLTNLNSLSLSWNQFSGSIPAVLGSLTNLNSLELGWNKFSGSIPAVMGSLTNLWHLELAVNQLSGSIPVELGCLTNLVYLSLSNNQLSGSLPVELGNLTNLVHLYLHSNQLSGSLPAELGNLINMQGLTLGGDRFSGSIPLSFLNLTALDYFYFYGTQLCEPNTPEFLAWKSTVTDWSGPGLICEEPVSWTLMYYLAGDHDEPMNQELGAEFDDISRSSINSDINRVIFRDKYLGQASYYAIPSVGESTTIEKGYLNSGDGATLSSFITWAKSTYPAENYALIISDHGNGLSGLAYDHEDFITPKELKEALSQTGQIDVLYAHACLFANLEIEFQLRGLVSYFVAHESIMWLPFNHSDYISKVFPGMSPRDLAIQMADSYFQKMRNPSAVSVIDMAFVETVALKTSALANGVRNNWPSVGPQFWSIINSEELQRFEVSGDFIINTSDMLADLYHLAELTKVIPQLETQSLDLLSTKNDYVIFNRSWGGIFTYKNAEYYWDHHYGFGVTIALPTSPASFYWGGWLDFAESANWIGITAINEPTLGGLEWGAMISELVLEFNPSGPDQSTPPPLVAPLYSYSIYLPAILR